MPAVLKPRKYFALRKSAEQFFTQRSQLFTDSIRILHPGTPYYRYTGYRSFLPQQESSGRTIWTPLLKDLSNRWSGAGPDRNGVSALYMSMDGIGSADTRFPELEHYQDSSLPPTQEVAYFEYQRGAEPRWVKAKAGELRSMFLYTSLAPLKGISLEHKKGEEGIFGKILADARSMDPGAFSAGDTVEKLYYDPDDASFCRAIGNTALSQQDVDFIMTTSVRDGASVNIALKGGPGTALTTLKGQGRSTFFIDSVKKTTKGVYTMDDLLYNNTFDETGAGVIPSREDFSAEIRQIADIGRTISDGIDWSMCRRNIDSVINNFIGSQLGYLTDPFRISLDELAKNMTHSSLTDQVGTTLSNYIGGSAPAAFPEYPDLYARIGSEGIHSLLLAEIIQPRLKDLLPSGNTDNYISLSVKANLAERKIHWLDQQGSSIQEQLAAATTAIGQTSDEIDAKNAELENIRIRLQEDPGNTDLKNSEAALQKQLDDLAGQLKDAERAKEGFDEKDRECKSDLRDTTEKGRKAKEGLEEKSTGIFGK
jgi:hypothetical protein